MANPVQWTVDQFWAELERIETGAKQVRANLEADKLQLQNAYASTRQDPDPARAAVNQAALKPLIHNNSTLRMRYKDLVAKFNQAVASAGGVLKSIGLKTPTLSGLGAVPLVIPAVAVAALLAALAILEVIKLQTEAQRRATRAMIAILNDPNATPAEKSAAAQALAKRAGAPAPDLFGSLVPILGLVALIMLGPPLLSAFGARRAAA